MNGQPCPRCQHQSLLLSTDNRYRNWCSKCDIRYDNSGELMPPMDEVTARDLFRQATKPGIYVGPLHKIPLRMRNE